MAIDAAGIRGDDPPPGPVPDDRPAAAPSPEPVESPSPEPVESPAREATAEPAEATAGDAGPAAVDAGAGLDASQPVSAAALLADPDPDPDPDGDPADTAAAPPREGSLLGLRGRYRLGELLGRGGASSVHRGWDRVLNRPVALKLLTYEIQPAPDDRHREARVVAALDHPGLVPVYDVSHLDGHDAVVMPLVEGPSLAARLRERGPLPLVEALRTGAEVAGGLAHVHAHDVVHRDVKPANILLGPRGARLTDFGIARAPGTTTLTGEGMILGTAAYLAPEQLRDDDVSPAVDVFALGLVLLECLTGRACYPSSPASCATRVDVCPEVPDDLPSSVAAAVRSLTALDPASRPTAAEAAARLDRLADAVQDGDVDALAAAAPPRTSPERPVPFGTAVIGLLLVGALLTAVIALVHGRADIAVPVLVAAVAAQGAVVWTTRGADEDAPSSRGEGPGSDRPPAPAGP